MNVPKTQSGRDCKLCLDKIKRGKNEPCHLHGGPLRKHSQKWRDWYLKEEEKFQQNWRKENREQWYTSLQKEIPFTSYEEWLEQHKYSLSPKSPHKKTEQEQWDELHGTFDKTPSKYISPGATEKFLPMELSKFASLPDPVMFEIMLKMTKYQLMAIVQYSKKAYKIYKGTKFQEEYKKRFDGFLGELKLTMQGKIGLQEKYFWLKDLFDNTVYIRTDNNEVVEVQYQPNIYQESQFSVYNTKDDYENYKIYVVYFGGKINIGMRTNRSKYRDDAPEAKIIKKLVLKTIGKEHWIGKSQSVSPLAAKEFVMEIANKVKNVLPEISFTKIRRY